MDAPGKRQLSPAADEPPHDLCSAVCPEAAISRKWLRGEHGMRVPRYDAQMRVLGLIPPVLLAIAAAGFSAHVASAQTPALECARLSNLPDDPPIGLKAPEPKIIEPSQAEAACRSALKADPANPIVLFQLGRVLSLGNKQLEAIKYYLDAADRGHAGAMNDLGGAFEYGIGIPKNLVTALVWYERAAELGHTGAMLHLGELNENGLDVPQDFANARHWYEKAAALSNAASMNSLANLFRQGRGGAPNLSAAADWYLKAAQLGLPSAMYSLGQLSEAGMGMPQNYQAARSWYKKAADLGNADAMGSLGALFESGRGGPQDLATAREWYVKGAALNGRVAMHNLGTMLENGRGTSKNVSEAKFWYERAAALEYPPALNDLGRLHSAGAGVPKNYVLAKNLFEQAATLGNAEAMNNLGTLYLNGRGVQRDISLARNLFERASALNNAEAQKNLKLLEQSGLVDGTQVAARRASCMQTCATLQRSYVGSACERYSATADNDNPERTKCVEMSLMLAKQCRDSCREWAFTPMADNKCLTCFQALIACTDRRESAASQPNYEPYVVHSKGCLAGLASCTANCRGQTAPTSGTPNTNREKPN
jgi:TPR repeat protein